MLKKITDAEVQGVYVESAPDKLAGTASENKHVFDKYPDLIKGKFNELVDDLSDDDGASNIGVSARFSGDGTDVSAQLKKAVVSKEGVLFIRINEDKVLETSTDGVEWEATGSSGHLIIDDGGSVMPQRGRLRFENTVVSDNGSETVVYGLKGEKGETGSKGATGAKGEKGEKGEKGDTGKVFVPNVNEVGIITWVLSDERCCRLRRILGVRRVFRV